MTSASPARALGGKVVVALEQAVAAPYATMRLADAGAEVIKIERPAVPLLNHEAGTPPRRLGLAHPSIAPYGVFATHDG